MSSYIMLHKDRVKVQIDDLKIYCDSLRRNQDPYIWNENFLHTYCKINQIKVSELKKGDKIFWFTRQGKSKWFVDLVFIVDSVHYWGKKQENQANSTEVKNVEFAHYNLVELSDVKYDTVLYEDHYKWAKIDHPKKSNKCKKRVTLIASEDSYQPQTENGELIEIDNSFKVFFEREPDNRGFLCKKLTQYEVNYIDKYIENRCNKKLTGEVLSNLRRDDVKWENKIIIK